MTAHDECRAAAISGTEDGLRNAQCMWGGYKWSLDLSQVSTDCEVAGTLDDDSVLISPSVSAWYTAMAGAAGAIVS